MSCCKILFWVFSVIVAIAAIFAGVLYYNYSNPDELEEVAFHLGDEGVQIFKAFDRNEDGYLSAQEFEPLYHSLIKREDDSTKV